jgi:glycosyltransferase involved in cell wall biosynthesis
MVAYTHYPTDSRVRREAEALVERGDTVDFICLGSEKDQQSELYNGVNLIKIYIKRYRGSSTLMYMASYLQFFLVTTLKLIKLQLANHYQIIQIHTMPDFMVFAAIIPRLLGAKVLLDVHDLMPELYQSKFGFASGHPLIRLITWIERISIGFADRALAVHKPHLEALRSHGNSVKKFAIVLNLPDMKIFSNGFNDSLVEKSSFELIYHGTVSERHGLETALRAIAKLDGKIERLKLKIIGDGDGISRLIKLVDELNLQKYVEIHKGMIPLDELVPKLHAADVGIVPILLDDFTRYMLPVKLLEYVALKKPVICSRTSTIEAYFDNSMVQYFSPGNINELADSIYALYSNSDRRTELVANADKFNREHSWVNQKQIYYQLIDDLVLNKVVQSTTKLKES